MVICKNCCDKKASYGYKKNGEKEFCNICAKDIPNLINLDRKLCLEENCCSEPNYNLPSEKSGIFCSKHKKPEMIDVKHIKCNYEDENKNRCLSLPSYGIVGEKATRCFKHKVDKMILIRNDLCKWKNGKEICTTRASFNIEGKKVGKFCELHKENGMIFVLKIDNCIEDNCSNKRALYNYLNEKKGLYCQDHKKEGMFNIKDKRCEFKDCSKIASYNFKDKKGYKFCDEHKLENMVNIRSKKCTYVDDNGICCELLPAFNFPNETIKLYCSKHKKDGMINVKNKKCLIEKCDNLALCNYKNITKRLYCCRHKLPYMVDLSNPCINDECLIKGNKKYDGYCTKCFYDKFPNTTKTRNHKIKETSVVEFIKDNFKEYNLLFDKIIPNGKSLRRPDIYFNLIDYSIIIEIDEYQHNRYNNIDEDDKVNITYNDLNRKPLIYIRFNPDNYIDKYNKKIKSCWKYDKDRKNILDNNELEKWNYRLNKLKDVVNYYIQNKFEEDIKIIYLFYNDYED